MTLIQEVLLRVESDYRGHPYYVTGHALYTAIARRADAPVRRRLQCSHGMVLPGEWGTRPDRHPDAGTGGLGKLATGLRTVESYADLMVYRDPMARWLRDDGPRDAHNALAIRTHGGRLAVAPTRYFGRPPHERNHKRSVDYLIHAFLHAGRGRDAGDPEGVLPVAADVLDGLRLGGARNYGFGATSLLDTRVIDLDDVDYSWVRDAQSHALELTTPYVCWTEYPGADDQSIPAWWGPIADWASETSRSGPMEAGTETPGPLRRRRARLIEDGQAYALGTVDHGQTVAYDGDRPVETARNGLLRIGTHSRYGFGELRVVPAAAVRMPGHAGVAGSNGLGTDPGGV